MKPITKQSTTPQRPTRRTTRALACVSFVVSSTVVAARDEPIKPIPTTLQQDPARVEIGRRLFDDVRLSANGKVSCASCHDLRKGGADGRARSVGFSGGKRR